MTFDEEMLQLEERTDLSELEFREESIEILKKWLPELKGEVRLQAQNNLAKKSTTRVIFHGQLIKYRLIEKV